MPRILSFGIDPTFLERRAQLLASSGLKVSSVSQKDEALRLAKAQPPDIAIFGHKVPLSLRSSLSNSLRKINPATRLIYIYGGSAEGTEMADAVLNIESEPETLVDTIKYLQGPAPDGPQQTQSQTA